MILVDATYLVGPLSRAQSLLCGEAHLDRVVPKLRAALKTREN